MNGSRMVNVGLFLTALLVWIRETGKRMVSAYIVWQIIKVVSSSSSSSSSSSK